MTKKAQYTGRPIEVLAGLHAKAYVTIIELCHYRNISLSKYFRDRAAGLITEPTYFGPSSPRHTAAEMRGESIESAA